MRDRVEIHAFGQCSVRFVGQKTIEIRGAKNKALVILLATAPLGRRTRTFLQNTLWGGADYDSGNQNLRRALSDLRKEIGPMFDSLIEATKSDVELNLDHVDFVDTPNHGNFLDGLSIPRHEFLEWLQSMRRNKDALAQLVSAAPKTSSPIRMKPLITAFPLTVIGGDHFLTTVSDWIAQEINRSLSRSNLVQVISHLSSRRLCAGTFDIDAIKLTLDVDYFLTGSLRPHGNELLAEMDFIQISTGQILWTTQVQSPPNSFTHDFYERLDHIIHSIGRSVSNKTIQHIHSQSLKTVASHDLLMAGVTLMHRAPLADFFTAREVLKEAINRQPKFSEYHAWMSKWHVLSVFKGLTTDRAKDTQRALDYSAAALDLDPENGFSLTIDGFAQANLRKDLDLADNRYRAAQFTNPNESLSWLLRGSLMAFQDNGKAAVKSNETARRLSPIDPFGYYYDSLASTAYLADQNLEKALEYADKSLTENDRHISTLRAKITALHELDRPAEARDCAQDLIRRFPDFRLENYIKEHPSAQSGVGKRVIEALKQAGIPS